MTPFFLNKRRPYSTTARIGLTAFSLALLAIISARSATAQTARGVISHAASEQFGLKRQWVTQIEVDPQRTKVTQIHLSFDKLFALTEDGLLQAVDAQSGKTDWKIPLGKPGYPSLGPGADAQHVAIVNGSTLYVVRRDNGLLVWKRPLGGAAGAGPAVTAKTVFVPLVSGKLEGYDIELFKQTPWSHPTDGRTFVQPLAAGGRLAWPTLKGYMYVAKIDPPELLYRTEARGRIVSSAAYKAPNFYMTSLDGDLYAFNEENGDIIWRFPAGRPISQEPVVINDRVYVSPVEQGMYCVSTETGDAIWHAPRVERFLAASPKRVYASDRYNRLHILDARTGAHLGMLPISTFSLQVMNWQTDRLYVGQTNGLIQCVRETDLVEPIVYAEPPPVEDEEKPATPPAEDGKTPDGKTPPDQPPAEKPDQPPAEVDPANPFAPQD